MSDIHWPTAIQADGTYAHPLCNAANGNFTRNRDGVTCAECLSIGFAHPEMLERLDTLAPDAPKTNTPFTDPSQWDSDEWNMLRDWIRQMVRDAMTIELPRIYAQVKAQTDEHVKSQTVSIEASVQKKAIELVDRRVEHSLLEVFHSMLSEMEEKGDE